MKPPKCATCGSEMLEFWSRIGYPLYICPHVVVSKVNRIDGKPRHVEYHCETPVDGPRAGMKKLAPDLDISDLQRATRFMIGDAKLITMANSILLSKVPPDRIPAIFDASTRLGLAMGRAPDKAIEDLAYGIRNMSPRRLDNLTGSKFDRKRAYQAYPDEDHDTAWKLYACDFVVERAGELS